MDIRKIVQRGRVDPAPSPSAAAEPVRTARAAPDIDVDASGYPDPRAILDSIGEVVYDWDIVSDRLNWGPNADRVLAVIGGQPIASGRAFSEFVTSDSATTRYAAIMDAAGRDEGAGVAYQARYGLAAGPRAGETVWVEDTGRWFAGADGKPERAHGLVRVITNHYQAERELEFRSRFDPLTGCYNRAHMIEVATRMLALPPGKSPNFSILLASIENLFVVNRTYGYDVADEVIAGVAKRLRGTMRGADPISRYAGGKFAIVLNGADRDQMGYAVQRFLDETSREPYETSAGPIPAGLRIGGVTAPRDGRTTNVLFQHVEEALDQARASSSTRFVAYEP